MPVWKIRPEEVKEISSRNFGEIAQVVTRYVDFIDKFIGDAVMWLSLVSQRPTKSIRYGSRIEAH